MAKQFIKTSEHLINIAMISRVSVTKIGASLHLGTDVVELVDNEATLVLAQLSKLIEFDVTQPPKPKADTTYAVNVGN